MKIKVITLFPKMIQAVMGESILGRAQEKGLIPIEPVDLREFGLGPRRQVDDTPYGGGAGMVLKVDVVVEAIRKAKENLNVSSKNRKLKVILLTPQGQTFNQAKAKELADDCYDLILVCGHYEGFDERIRDYVDEEISIGDYILTGGELAAAVVIDAVARLLPGVLGKEESHQDETFSTGARNSKLKTLLEYPHYTRPEEFEGKKVPQVLLSGHHAEIEKWRLEQSLKKTKDRRPDLLK